MNHEPNRRILYTRLAGKEPGSQETKTTISNLVHWAYGMLQAGRAPGLRRGHRPGDAVSS